MFAAQIRADKHTVQPIPLIIALHFLVLEKWLKKGQTLQTLHTHSVCLTTAPCTQLQHVEKSKDWQVCCAWLQLLSCDWTIADERWERGFNEWSVRGKKRKKHSKDWQKACERNLWTQGSSSSDSCQCFLDAFSAPCQHKLLNVNR